MDLDEAIATVDQLLDTRLREKRAAHSRGVAEYAAHLCSLHGIDPRRGRLAGLAHDLCKEMPKKAQWRYARVYAELSGRGLPPSDDIGEAVVHAPASAGYLAEELGFKDADILEAMALHSLGARDMAPLALLVYAADKLEPGRHHVDPEFRARCETLAPPALFFAVMENTIAWMKERDMPIAGESLELYEWFSHGRMEA